MGQKVGSVAALTRFPVKSMIGEDLTSLELEPRGVVGDRVWAVYTADGGIGSGKTSRRFRRIDGLLNYRSWTDDGRVLVEGPDGAVLVVAEPATDAALSWALGLPLTLRLEGAVPHYDDSPVHLVTTASLRGLGSLLGEPVDPRRFRANVVVDVPGNAFAEDEWAGRELAIGRDVVVRIGPGMPRCVMVSAEQRDLPADSRVLKSIGTRPGVEFGSMVDVVSGGVIREGDPVTLR